VVLTSPVLPCEDAIGAAQELMQARTGSPPEPSTVQEIDRKLRRFLPSMDPVWAEWTVFRRRLEMEAGQG
jgi:hypothetical protein